MFNVSVFLLDDALLNCVVTEVVLFPTLVFEDTDISQGSVATHLKCGGAYFLGGGGGKGERKGRGKEGSRREGEHRKEASPPLCKFLDPHL